MVATSSPLVTSTLVQLYFPYPLITSFKRFSRFIYNYKPSYPNILDSPTPPFFPPTPCKSHPQYSFIIIMYQKLFPLMSADEPEELDQNEDFPYQPPKFLTQNTTICFKHKNTYQSAIYEFENEIQNSIDCSFEQGIHRENVEVLKNATIRFLEESIRGDFNKNEGFRDRSLFENLPFEAGEKSDLESLVLHNDLLCQRERQDLLKTLKEDDELVGFLKQLTPTFGVTISKEITYAAYLLLKEKLAAFKALITPKNTFLPKFNCFQGMEDEESLLITACSSYDDINLEEIPGFAEKGIEELTETLYNSGNIKYLNLRETRRELKGDTFYKFKLLMKQLSKTIFFTVVGAIQPANSTGSALFALDLSRELSFSDFPEGNILPVHRSISRPFAPHEDDPVDHPSKKQKLD